MSPRISKFAITTLTLAALATAIVAPAAEAGRRYKRHDGPSRVHHPKRGHGPKHTRVVEVHRVSNGGAVLAGIIGGIALGAVLANAADDPPRHVYVDPYCDERYTSLDVYQTHCHRHDHPKVVRVIEVGSGRCVSTYRYREGRWCEAPEWHGH